MNPKQMSQLVGDLQGKSAATIDETLRRKHLDVVERICIKQMLAAAEAALPRQPRRVSAQMAILTTGGEMAHDRAEWRPGQRPGQEPPDDMVDRDLQSMGFRKGKKYALHTVNDRLRQRFPDHEVDAVTRRLAAKVRMHELRMIDHDQDAPDQAEWEDPRRRTSGMASGRTLQASAERRQGTLLVDRHGRPRTLRSIPE